MKFTPSLLLFFAFVSLNINAQRQVKTINSGWDFRLENSTTTKTVNIPHTWNAEDAFIDDTQYFRGKGIYEREIYIPEEWKNQSVFIKFEGANQVTQVFVNGKPAGKHTGGYTAFIFEITDLLEFEKNNQLKIEVDNSHNTDIPPLEADFNFYGGIYRDLELVITGKSHFELEGEAAGNLKIETPTVTKNQAKVKFSGNLVKPESENLKLEVEILSPKGKKVNSFSKNIDSEISI